jgi:hypothetical protein
VCRECVGFSKTKKPRRKKFLVRNNLRRGFEAPPVGAEHPTKSPETTPTSKNGAAESAAVDPDLALIVKRWTKLTAHAKATIMGIVRASKRK